MSQKEQFIKWLEKMGNIYLADNERIQRALTLIDEY